MSAAPQRMTLEEFLDREARQDRKHEFDDFVPVALTGGALTGGSAEHAAIQINLIAALHNRLRGGPCRVFGSELKIVAAGSIR